MYIRKNIFIHVRIRIFNVTRLTITSTPTNSEFKSAQNYSYIQLSILIVFFYFYFFQMTLRLVVYHIKMNDSLKVIRKIFPFNVLNKTQQERRKLMKNIYLYIHISVICFCFFKNATDSHNATRATTTNYDTNT